MRPTEDLEEGDIQQKLVIRNPWYLNFDMFASGDGKAILCVHAIIPQDLAASVSTGHQFLVSFSILQFEHRIGLNLEIDTLYPTYGDLGVGCLMDTSSAEIPAEDYGDITAAKLHEMLNEMLNPFMASGYYNAVTMDVATEVMRLVIEPFIEDSRGETASADE